MNEEGCVERVMRVNACGSVRVKGHHGKCMWRCAC